MTPSHEFGGDWTERKLDILRRYLVAYSRIFEKNAGARYFRTWYVDGFAGTGYRTMRQKVSGSEEASRSQINPVAQISILEDMEAAAERDGERLRKGSTRIALEIQPGFDQYLFIEHSPRKARELERLKADFPSKAGRVRIQIASAEESLVEWCEQTNWKTDRAVVFLDPFGMQVSWHLLETIARTHAIDLWLLFPIGVAVNRLLLIGEPPPPIWSEALTRTFGTDAWKQRFYRKPSQLSFIEEPVTEVKTADLSGIASFFIERLHTIFAAVAPNPRPLVNSRGVPLYLLCFAAGNERGAPVGLKIAKHLLENF